MNEEAIKDAYGLFSNTGYNGSYEDFKQLIQSNPEARADAYGLFANTGYNGSQQEFDQLMGVGGPVPVKKKEEPQVLPWNQKQEQAKPKPEPALPFLESKPSGISLGSARVPETAPMFEAPPMRTPEEAQAIVETPEYKETSYFTGAFGDLLKNMQSPWNPAYYVAEFIDDFGRAVAQGSAQSDIVSPTSSIFLNGSKTSDEEITKFRKASELASKLGPSDEMVKFSEEYEKGGKTATSFLKALATNPGAIPEIMVSSYTSMVNAPSLAAGGAAIGTGAAVAGAPGAVAAIPYAMAAMGATLETNLSLAESIKDKLAQDGLEWNDENIKAVISDEKFLKDARIKAATRGVTIGAIDALTGRVAGKVGAKLIKAPKAGVAKAGLAAGGIEAVGGSTGEATARALTGQEMDIAEIGLEGIAELPGTIVSVGSEVLKKPLYKVNGEIRPEADVKEIVETADGDQLAKINIEITNDTKGYNEQIQEKVVSAQVKNEVKEVNPDLDEETTNEITRLEMELKKVEGKKTQSAKDKAASIRSQIKTLQENAVQEPSTEEGVLRPEESQVGLQEVGEGDTQEQAPAPEVVKEEVVKEEVVTPDEEVAAALDRIEIPEDTEALPGIDDELKTINESIGRVKEEVDRNKDEQTLQDLSDKVARAKKNIATADDTDVAIEEFKKAEKEKTDFEEAASKKKNFNKVEALIADEIYQKDRGNYEYQELFDQDPRLAAIQSAKDTIELGKGDFLDEEGVARYENDIKILEEDIAKFPVKQAEAAPKVSSKTPKVKTPKAKSVPIPVAIPKPTPKPAPAPAPKPASVVSQPTTKAVGPVALQEEYTNKIAEVRLNQDKSRTPKQIDERVKELQAEYKKLKAEMTAPKPKSEAKPAPKKAAPAPKAEAKAEPVVSKKDQEAIKQLESEIEYQERQIEDAIEEIGNTKYNLKEALAEIKKKRDALKGQKMSAEARAEAKEELEAEIENAKEEHDTYLEEYNDQLSEAKKEKKKAETKLAKLQAKSTAPVSVVQEEEPSYDDIKDLDVSDPTFLEIVEGFLDDMDDGLSEFGRGNLSSGMAIPLAKAIIKSLKVLVRAGITLQEAIKRVAADNNLETKDVVNMIKDLDKAQSPMAKLKSQIQNEVQSVKDGVRSANEAVEAIVKYFNFNAERGNLTRRDLGRVINAIAKVKDQKSLDKAADKIFSIIDKAKTDIVEVSSSKALVSQIKLEARAALGAKKDINQKRKDLSNVIKAMETTGKISAAKAKAILNKIGRVNLDNPASVDAFLDYVENVFEDAAYEVELAGINAKLAKARNNVNRKIGTAKNLTPILNRLFSIKPSLIPAEVFDSYKELIDMFGDSAAVLDLAEITEVTQQAQDILNQIDDQLSTVPALATKLFNYSNAVLTEDGALDYSATIEKMLADGTIDQAEYDLMRKYKSYILPRAVKIPKTKEELAEEKKVLVKQAKEAASEATISPLASDDEKKMASSIIKLSKTKAVEGLDNRQLENLLKIFENFKNGYFPAYANGINNDLIAAENAGFLSKAIAKAKMPTLLSVKAKLRNRREALFAKVKSAPLFNIDEIFGDFKTKDIFNSIFNALAQNQQRYALEIEKINQRLEDALNKIAKSYGNNENKIVESKMRMAIYRIQREFKSNPGDPRVNPAIEYINKTVEAIREGNTNYSEEDADMLEKIAKDYSDGKGGIDSDKLKESFNTAENEALDLFDELNKTLEDKATFTGDVIRGDKVRLLNNYNHISVLPTKNENPDTIADAISKFDPKNVVSTKAKSLIERTTGAKPINFDVFSTVQRGANFVLMDYYLTNPVRIARKTINATRNMMEENGTFTEDAKTILNVVSDAVELALKASLDQSVIKDTFADKVIKEIARTGYRAMLGGIPRATTELTSNMAYIAMVAPQEWSNGVKVMKGIDGAKAVNIMEAVGSKVITRNYGSDPLKGRLIDPSVLSKRVGIGASKLKGETKNVIATIHNNTTKKVKNSAEFLADTLMSSPDKIMMRPLWFGSFDKAFQDFAGKKPDYDKIEANDADYMIQNKEALEAAGRVADEKVTMAGNVENPYMNALRTHISSDMSALTKTFKMFDNFMLRFQIGDFLVARRGIQAMMGNGNISKDQGAKLMAAVVTRMTIYTIMTKMAAEFFYGLFLDDEEEDDDKSFAQKMGQGLASTFTSLLLGRDFGNVARSMVNYGVEKANEKYLDFLRDGEYDPYEDAIQYTFIPPEKKGKSLEAFDVIANISGPYSPALKSLNLVTKKLTEEPKKEGPAIERQEAEKNVRVPLEILGNLGYVPLYKDIRAIVNKSIYSELDKELDEQGQKEEEFKPMGLNKSDLKRYYPEIYEQYYGEGTEDAARRKLEREKDILEQRMKDDYYNYVPKQGIKSGFGGKKFGEGSKKSKGFGSSGFGSGR